MLNTPVSDRSRPRRSSSASSVDGTFTSSLLRLCWSRQIRLRVTQAHALRPPLQRPHQLCAPTWTKDAGLSSFSDEGARLSHTETFCRSEVFKNMNRSDPSAGFMVHSGSACEHEWSRVLSQSPR